MLGLDSKLKTSHLAGSVDESQRLPSLNCAIYGGSIYRVLTYTVDRQEGVQHYVGMYVPKLPKQKTTIPTKELLAKNLVRLRAERQMSQEDLSYLSGLSRTVVGHIERQQRNVTLETLEALAVGLKVSVRDLFDESN